MCTVVLSLHRRAVSRACCAPSKTRLESVAFESGVLEGVPFEGTDGSDGESAEHVKGKNATNLFIRRSVEHLNEWENQVNLIYPTD